MENKALIFDSGTLINFAMNGILNLLEPLKKQLGGYFLITQQVKDEIIDHPLNIKRFELEALQIQTLLEQGVLQLPSSVGVSDQVIEDETRHLLDKANHYLKAAGSWLNIVSAGEISCLALSDECNRKGIQTLIGVDERTTRLLAEKPENLERLMSDRLKQRVQLVAKDFQIFQKYRFIRSSELVYVAYKKGLVNLKGGKRVLEALLYATKFKGSSISFEEIDELKNL